MKALGLLAASFLLLGGAGVFAKRPVQSLGEEGLTHKYSFDKFLTKNEATGMIDLRSYGASLTTFDEHKCVQFTNNAYFEIPSTMLSGNAVTFDMDI